MPDSKVKKLGALLGIALRRPNEAFDRMRHVAEVRLGRWVSRPPRYTVTSLSEVEEELSRRFGASLSEYRGEIETIEAEIQARLAETRASNPITAVHDADFTLSRLCYCLARLSRPERVVETGVASGVSSCFLLHALEANACGVLHSIDLPPLGRAVDDFVGVLVPERLRYRWHLHRGSSRRILPPLLESLGELDLFLHDALHTYWSQRTELDQISPYLAANAVILADDIEENAAFEEWIERRRPRYSTVIEASSKSGLIGLALFEAGP